MVIGIIGENCSGKSTLAERIRDAVGAEVVTGKDYLRLARSEAEAASLFRTKLRGPVAGENVVYVISEPEQLKLLPEGAMLLTYEQAMRFGTDYLNGDTYFKINYEKHNLVRTKAQIALLADMEKKADAMREVVKNAVK